MAALPEKEALSRIDQWIVRKGSGSLSPGTPRPPIMGSFCKSARIKPAGRGALSTARAPPTPPSNPQGRIPLPHHPDSLFLQYVRVRQPYLNLMYDVAGEQGARIVYRGLRPSAERRLDHCPRPVEGLTHHLDQRRRRSRGSACKRAHSVKPEAADWGRVTIFMFSKQRGGPAAPDRQLLVDAIRHVRSGSPRRTKLARMHSHRCMLDHGRGMVGSVPD